MSGVDGNQESAQRLRAIEFRWLSDAHDQCATGIVESLVAPDGLTQLHSNAEHTVGWLRPACALDQRIESTKLEEIHQAGAAVDIDLQRVESRLFHLVGQPFG